VSTPDPSYRDEPTNGHGGVRIGNRELYDAIQRLEHQVIRMEGRIDKVLGENVDLGKRVRSMELKMYGILAGLVGTLGYVVLSLGSKGHL
jgi:hypothetical protein